MARKNLLNREDICSIIEVCSQNKVSELKFGDLHLSFVFHVEQSARPQASFEAVISEDELKNEEKNYLAERELEVKRDEIDQMLIEDPAKFEELLEQGEFDADEFARDSDAN